MEKRQIKNSETSEVSEISEILFLVFFISKSSILPYSFPRFTSFPSFRPGLLNMRKFWI